MNSSAFPRKIVFICSILASLWHLSGAITLEITSPMAPPSWALMERELLRTNATACEEFFSKYFDERGYLLCIERWGGDDGPDDAIENVADWPILHALGGDDSILRMYRKAWEGHLKQYTEAKTVDVPFARDGMYYKEFPVMMDWMHNGEGLRVFNLQGLSDPYNLDYQKRVRRFAGFYMNEDPGALNYDYEHKIIKSMFNGSRGPLMRKTTGLDWAGDPIEVENRFHLVHGERNYDEMVAHFKDYNDILGDHPQNLSATTLALNAYILTGEEKYRKWMLDYVDAWLDRMEANNGIIPSSIGLDGTIGGETDGKWWGSVYGWGFTVVVPQNGELAHRTRVYRAVDGFGNAYLLTGDRKYIDTWTAMIDIVNSNARVMDGVKHYPYMYGDDGWYDFKPEPVPWGTLNSWFWTMDEKDKKRVSSDPWVRFLDGKDPDYPVRELGKDFSVIRDRVAEMRADTTTPDTRLSDDPMKYNPATVQTLNKLMMAGLDPGRGAAPLHCRVRYFDPENRRAGIPKDVAALIDKVSDDELRLTLVNVSQTHARELILQTGAYAEHRIDSIDTGDEVAEVGDPTVRIKLAPGCGQRLVIANKRYALQPRMDFPWDR
ncbi:MAG: hypothetical protein CMI18_00010 [Opitutaceae bacterium]|nr:hypothetical protein [Opitutaceae bacterium]